MASTMLSASTALLSAIVLILLIADGVSGFPDEPNARNGTLRERLRRRHHRIKGKIKKHFESRQHPEKEPEGEGIEGASSVSRTQLKGWFKIFVVGTGKACYTKEYQRRYTRQQQFGEFATSEAFMKFFGEPECEEGDRGIAWGKIKASVVAAAYEKGEECLTRVLSAVITDPRHQFSKGDVRVRISGEAEGEALALCEVPDIT